MTNKILSHHAVLFFVYVLAVQAKIVYLNGTEVTEDNLKFVNGTTSGPVLKWFSMYNPRNISNHSGDKTKYDLHTINRKDDAEEQESAVETVTEEYDDSSNTTLSTRDTTVLSSLRGIWTDLSPMITILSTIIGLFLIFVMIQSPLSPLPVPPLPYPPIGPFPPTNIYPFGIPPDSRHPYSVRYAGPSSHASYRIPRNFQPSNETETMENMIEKIISSLIPGEFDDFFSPKKSTWAEQLAHSIKSFFNNIGQLQLFYAQRFLNGMHLLALLAGIYLMIFVVEPVAVPNHYLAQHYYGVPWSADRRLHRDRLETIPVLERKSFFVDSVGKQQPWILNENLKSSQLFQQQRIPPNKPKIKNYGPVVKPTLGHRKNNSRPLTGTARVRYVSAQDLHAKRNDTNNSARLQHWSKWIPPQNSTTPSNQKNIDTLYWSPSVKVAERSKSNSKENARKTISTAGSATSVRLTELLA